MLKKPRKVDIKIVRGFVYRSLAMREWARKMLCQKLMAKYGREHASIINDVLDEFEKTELLSDSRFAECYIRSCRDSRGYGAIKTKMKLFEKGIKFTDFEEYLSERHDIWFVRCAKAQHKKYGGQPETIEEYATHQRFLVQRGFTGAQIKAGCYSTEYWLSRDDIIVPEEERDMENCFTLDEIKKTLG